MGFHLVVIRKDAPLRWYFCAMSACKPRIDEIRPFAKSDLRNVGIEDTFVDDNGGIHADLAQYEHYTSELINQFNQDSRFFLKLATHFRGVGESWLMATKEINSASLSRLSDNELARLIELFFEGYSRFSPALYFVFPVERLQKDLYPMLLEQVTSRAIENVSQNANYSDSLASFIVNLINLQSMRNDFQERVRNVLEFPSEMTFAEKRDLELSKIALAVGEDSHLRKIFEEVSPPTKERVHRDAPVIYDRIVRALEEYRWIKQWGFPPLYTASTFEDFVSEIKKRVKEVTADKLKEIEGRSSQGRKTFESFVRLLPLNRKEVDLVETINTYEFFRTWRMEIIIQCQYLSVPLFMELERRCVSREKLKPGSIFHMTAPEIMLLAQRGEVPKNMDARQSGWGILVRDGVPRIIVAHELESYRRWFYSVLGCDERARGTMTHTNQVVGGKAENLYILRAKGFPVTRYFVVTTNVFKESVRNSEVFDQIKKVFGHSKIETLITASDSSSEGVSQFVSAVSNLESSIKQMIKKIQLPQEAQDAILNMFDELGAETVAVRSSATAEDSSALSWAGRFYSFLFVRREDIIDRVKEVWASLYSRAALQYALQNGVDILSLDMAVIVQEMLDSNVSGVLNTRAGLESENAMEIEAALGQCSPVVNGEITPDRYILSRTPGHPELRESISEQSWQLGSSGRSVVPDGKRSLRKLNSSTTKQLADMALKIEAVFEKPQDVEWALKGKEIFILQTRPQTGLRNPSYQGVVTEHGAFLISGMKGRVSTSIKSVARVISRVEEGDRLRPGEILVTHGTTPMWDLITARAGAIITNEGGSTCHAIRVANERGLPAVVGTGKATSVIKDGETILVDTTGSFEGRVYRAT